MSKLTPWFNAKSHSPVREGWYDCKECNDRHYFKEGVWYRDKKSLSDGPMIIREMHWRGLLAPHPTSWKSFLESDLRATDDFERAIRAGREEAKKAMLKPYKFGKFQKKSRTG